MEILREFAPGVNKKNVVMAGPNQALMDFSRFEGDIDITALSLKLRDTVGASASLIGDGPNPVCRVRYTINPKGGRGRLAARMSSSLTIAVYYLSFILVLFALWLYLQVISHPWAAATSPSGESSEI